jgi:hypothetical protein
MMIGGRWLSQPMNAAASLCFNFFAIQTHFTLSNERRKRMHIKYVDGHYEIVSADNGQFIQSADTWDEALDDMKELLTTTV